MQRGSLIPSTISHNKEFQISGVTFLYTLSCNSKLQISDIIPQITDCHKKLILEDCLNTSKKWDSK